MFSVNFNIFEWKLWDTAPRKWQADIYQQMNGWMDRHRQTGRQNGQTVFTKLLATIKNGHIIQRFDCILILLFSFQNILLKFSSILLCLSQSPHRWFHTVTWDLLSSSMKSIALSKTFQQNQATSTSNTQQIQSLHIRSYQICSI